MTRLSFVPVLVPTLAGAILLAGSPLAWAETQFFTIDSQLTSVTISGQILGNTISEQGPGSLTTHARGQIGVELTGSALRFPGGSIIELMTNGTWSPLPDGGEGSAPANYGGKASSFLGSAVAAMREVKLDLLSAMLPVSSQGQFDGSSLVFAFPVESTAKLCYRANVLFVGTLSGSIPLSGLSTNHLASGSVTSEAGKVVAIQIPIDATLILSLMNDNDTTIHLKGQIVANRGAEPLRIDTIRYDRNSASVILEWQAAPGTTYQVQGSTSLKDWQNRAAGTVPANGRASWSTPATAPGEYFRLAH